jgi:hypothetical protein
MSGIVEDLAKSGDMCSGGKHRHKTKKGFD